MSRRLMNKSLEKTEQNAQKASGKSSFGAKKWASWGWSILAGFVLIIGALAYLPRVSITPNGTLDPENIYSATFTVTNTSSISIPLEHVYVRASICQSVTEPLPFRAAKKWTCGSGGFALPDWQDRTLQIDEPFTVSLQHIIELGKMPPPYQPTRLSGANCNSC